MVWSALAAARVSALQLPLAEVRRVSVAGSARRRTEIMGYRFVAFCGTASVLASTARARTRLTAAGQRAAAGCTAGMISGVATAVQEGGVLAGPEGFCDGHTTVNFRQIVVLMAVLRG